MPQAEALSTASPHNQDDQRASQLDCGASGPARRGEGYASPGLQSVESPGDLLCGNHNLLLKAFCRNSFVQALGTAASFEEGEVMTGAVAGLPALATASEGVGVQRIPGKIRWPGKCGCHASV